MKKKTLSLDRQFEEFKVEFFKWYNWLGLNDWEVEVEKKHIEDSDSTLALVSPNMEQKSCAVNFFGSNKYPYDISELALHEVLHILLFEATPNTKIQHGIIHRLVKCIFKKFNDDVFMQNLQVINFEHRRQNEKKN